MLPRRVSVIKAHQPRSAGSKRVSAFSSAFMDHGPGAVVLYGGRQVGSRSNNSVHPVVPILKPSVSRPCESVPTPGSDPTTADSVDLVVKVRVLHGIDLFIPSTKSSCQHPRHPAVNITVSGNPVQSSTAAQHARNHSIWKKHELTFQVHAPFQAAPVAGGTDAPPCLISMHVSLSYTVCSCASKEDEGGLSSIEIGEVGELQLPAKASKSYEISRFFPVIRRQHKSSQSACILLPAGKVKLWIRIEKPAAVYTAEQPEIPKRPPFALPTNFGEALQLKRKQLKATVVPEDSAQEMSKHQAFHADPGIATELMKEIAAETAPDQIGENDLTVEGRVGEGIHSCVCLGALRRSNNGSTRPVAVKEFRHQHAVPPVSVLRAFIQEYRILARCRGEGGYQHIVDLFGVTVEPRLIIMMEYFDRGSLAQCLQDEAVWGRVSIKQKTLLGLKIARGIAWLHKHDMIHRDIKSHNILISGDLTTPSLSVKIGDLGSAVVRQQHEPLLLEEVGSSGYTAPEILTPHGYDSKVDVYSFGVVLWELASSCVQDRFNPFMGMANDAFVAEAQGGCRPKLAHAHQVLFGPIIEKCWRFDPSQRPDMDEVVIQLEKLIDEL